MKRILLAVSSMTMLMTGMAFAEAETPEAQTPVVDQRPANQAQRIDQEVASRQLNDQKATQLNKQQKPVNKKEDKAKSDGVMTEEQKKEWAGIGPPQNRTTRRNAREKLERQGRHR